MEMKDEYKVVCALSNSAIFDDLEWPRTPVSRSQYSLKANISQTVQSIYSVFGSYRVFVVGGSNGAICNSISIKSKVAADAHLKMTALSRITLASAGLSCYYPPGCVLWSRKSVTWFVCSLWFGDSTSPIFMKFGAPYQRLCHIFTVNLSKVKVRVQGQKQRLQQILFTCLVS